MAFGDNNAPPGIFAFAKIVEDEFSISLVDFLFVDNCGITEGAGFFVSVFHKGIILYNLSMETESLDPKQELQQSLIEAKRQLREKHCETGIGLNVSVLEVSSGSEPSVIELYTDPEDENQYIFLASLIKVPMMLWLAEWVEQDGQGRTYAESGIPLGFGDRSIKLLAEELVKYGAGEEVDAFVSESLWPMISDVSQLRNILDSIKVQDSGGSDPEQITQIESILKEKLPNFSISIDDLIRLSLGPSSNFSVYLLRDFIYEFQDIAQAYIDRWLERIRRNYSKLARSIPEVLVQRMPAPSAIGKWVLPDDRHTQQGAFESLSKADNSVTIAYSSKAEKNLQHNFGCWDEIVAMYVDFVKRFQSRELSGRRYELIWKSLTGELYRGFDFRHKYAAELSQLGFESRGKVGFMILPAKNMGIPFMLLNGLKTPDAEVPVLSASTINFIEKDGKSYVVAYSFAVPDLELARRNLNGSELEQSETVQSLMKEVSDVLAEPVMKYLRDVS